MCLTLFRAWQWLLLLMLVQLVLVPLVLLFAPGGRSEACASYQGHQEHQGASHGDCMSAFGDAMWKQGFVGAVRALVVSEFIAMGWAQLTSPSVFIFILIFGLQHAPSTILSA